MIPLRIICMSIRFIFIILMCMVLPACVKKNTHTMLKNKSNDSIDLCKKTLIDNFIDERFEFCPSEHQANHVIPSQSVGAIHKKQTTELSSLSICQAKLFDIPIPMQAVFRPDE